MIPCWQLLVLIAVILLNAYSFGASMVERFVNYQTWPLVPPSAFQTYHHAQTRWIQIVIVAPLALSLVMQGVLICFYRSLGISFWPVWTMLFASGIGAVSTMLVQVPIHRHFDQVGYSTHHMERLLSSDWVRKVADLVRIVATGALIAMLVRQRGLPY